MVFQLQVQNTTNKVAENFLRESSFLDWFPRKLYFRVNFVQKQVVEHFIKKVTMH